jgi:hypothetical protein
MKTQAPSLIRFLADAALAALALPSAAQQYPSKPILAVNSPEVREKLIAQGLEPIGSPPAMVTQWTQDGLTRMRNIVQRAKIQAE